MKVMLLSYKSSIKTVKYFEPNTPPWHQLTCSSFLSVFFLFALKHQIWGGNDASRALFPLHKMGHSLKRKRVLLYLLRNLGLTRPQCPSPRLLRLCHPSKVFVKCLVINQKNIDVNLTFRSGKKNQENDEYFPSHLLIEV